jgi:hypothetical protein
VQSVAGRTGAVVISTSDVSGYTAPPVTSVAGRTGAVTISTSDVSGYTAPPVTSVAGRTGAVTIASGDVSGLAASATTDTTNAANISSGTISAARLGSGSASSSTYLRGDSTWAAVGSTAPVTNTPTTLSAGANDYSLPSADIVRLAASAAVTITGFSASTASSYPIVLIENVGSYTITVANNSSSSSAANRVVSATGGDVTVAANDSLTLVYDGTSSVWRTVGSADNTNAANLSSGTLPDARLSSAVALHAQINTTLGQASGVVDAMPRVTCISGVTASAGQLLMAFFTPTATVTVSQIAMATGTGAVASGLTLARMGIYTYTEGGTATLVARTASDTSLFAANNTIYTRSLDTTGGYPSTYTLTAGTRYGVAFLCVGSTQPQIVGRAVPTGVGASFSPRLSGSSNTGQTDLPTSFTPSVNSQAPFARMS